VGRPLPPLGRAITDSTPRSWSPRGCGDDYGRHLSGTRVLSRGASGTDGGRPGRWRLFEGSSALSVRFGHYSCGTPRCCPISGEVRYGPPSRVGFSVKVENAFGARKFGEARVCNGTLDLDLTLATIRQTQPGGTLDEIHCRRWILEVPRPCRIGARGGAADRLDNAVALD
jgi:hypothetical protein